MEDLVNDRFRVLETLGKGGFGRVYLVEDLHFEGASVRKALKIPHVHVADEEEFRRRFQREMSILLRLNHEHIAPIRDTGVTRDGRPFYTMDYCEGRTLAEVVRKEGPLSPARVLALGRKILGALVYAHRQGVLHLDLKPANLIVIATPGEEEDVRILDFGIGRILSGSHARASMTQMSQVMGTPNYLPPEQLKGEVDARTDVYATGATLYELLSGEAPFTGTTFYEILEKVHREVPKPITSFRKDVPPTLVRSIERALSKEPDGRFASAGEFLASLEPPRGTVPLSSKSTGTVVEPVPAHRSSRRILTIAAPVVAVAATLAILFTFVSRNDGEPRPHPEPSTGPVSVSISDDAGTAVDDDARGKLRDLLTRLTEGPTEELLREATALQVKLGRQASAYPHEVRDTCDQLVEDVRVALKLSGWIAAEEEKDLVVPFDGLARRVQQLRSHLFAVDVSTEAFRHWVEAERVRVQEKLEERLAETVEEYARETRELRDTLDFADFRERALTMKRTRANLEDTFRDARDVWQRILPDETLEELRRSVHGGADPPAASLDQLETALQMLREARKRARLRGRTSPLFLERVRQVEDDVLQFLTRAETLEPEELDLDELSLLIGRCQRVAKEGNRPR